MAEYIERRTAIEAAKHAWAKGREPSQYIETLPAADVAPVVRCRDCANFRQNVRGGCWCDEYGGVITPEDYCSRAVTDKPSRVKIPWEAD